MRVGDALLDLARAGGARSLFVVGTGKNVGKTVVVRAVAERAVARGLALGLTSLGRDGESADALDAQAKPRLRLAPGTVVATARDVLPRHPASEILALSDLQTAAGTLLYARVRRPADYELVGPPTASGIRSAVARLFELGCEQTIVDGAIDRVAALAGGADAIVVAAGASGAASQAEAVEAIAALVRRLSLPRYDPSQPFVRVEGALTAALAALFTESAERHQIVVGDPTQITIAGKAFDRVADRFALRCERPLRVVAATVAPIGREGYFEPRGFAHAVADATGLPTFDVFAAAMVAA